ncbi:LytTR family DNA-binding domain-containing protein [Flavobacteriaceae bacterium]|nr:LytTR family DNA-binding domain-containing protein [Flavobacteriaceae bacterium]
MLLNYIIVDSNAFDRLKLTQHAKKVKILNFKAEFSNAVEALDYLNYNNVDVVFLAADLPVYSGFEFIDKLRDKINIILMSKDPEDAFKAYEYGLLDCIEIPMRLSRIEKSIDRLKYKIETEKLIKQKKENFLLVKYNLKNEKIILDKINYIEATGDYVKIVTSSKNYIVLSTMKGMINRLPKKDFLRIHKSYIVNIKRVTNYTTNTILVSGKELPLSRNHKKKFQVTYEKA